MTTIEQLLGDLLLRHNCVIVPSFGGFVARQVSARVDYASGKMYPPSKSLLFNKQLINNDGLLITEYARTNEVSYEEAGRMVREKVQDWNTSLKSGARIELDRIGYLYLDAEKNLCFEQDRFFNLLLESFGLGQVHFLTEEDVKLVEKTVALVEEEVAPQVETEPLKVVAAPQEKKVTEPVPLKVVSTKPAKEEPVVIKPSRKKVWRYVAAACILPIAFYSVWIPMKTDVLESGVLSINDFNPFHTASSGAYEKQEVELPDEMEEPAIGLEEQVDGLEGVDTYTYAYTPGMNIPVALEKREESVDVVSENETPAPVTETPAFSANTMYFIVGCFGMEENAVNMVSKLKSEGFDATIVDVHNGLHRVSAGGAISKEALGKIKSAATAGGYSGWILK